MKKADILKQRVDNNPDRAAAMGVALHKAKKVKPKEAMPVMNRAANLGKYHHPPRKK